MARTKNPAPHAARSAADAATTPAPAPVAPAAGDSPAAAVLAALSAEPAGAAVAVIAARAGISIAAARQALLAHEKAGTATRVKGSKPGIADTWTPAAPTAAPGGEAPPAEASGAGSAAEAGQPPAEPAGGTADAAQPAPAPAGGTAEGQQAEAGTDPGPDPAVAAEAAGSVLAIAEAANAAGQALAAGDLPAALAALETAREQAAQGRRAVKAAASGRRAPATRPGALRDLVEEHLRKFPDAAFTPHQVGKVLTRSAGAVANALDKLTGLGTAQMVTDKPRTYRLAPAAPARDAAGGPAADAEPAASVA
jgi:DprA winged helix domain